MIKRSLHIFLLFVALAGAANAYASEADSIRRKPTVRAWMTPDSVAIGDRMVLAIEVDKDVSQSVAFPDFDFSEHPDLELVGEPVYDTISSEGRRVTLRRNYTLTSFQEGQYNLGRLSVLSIDRSGADTLHSAQDLIFDVTTFLIDSTAHGIFDLKPVQDMPFQFREISGYVTWSIIGLLLLCAIVYGVLRLLAHYGRPVMGLFKTPPPLPPHVEALRELERLYGEKLWQLGEYKDYYSRLTDILRNYIYRRYGVVAVSMSTDEIIAALRTLELPPRCEMELQSLLRDADLVKFAKAEIGASQNETYFATARDFVEQTKIVEEGVDEEAIDEVAADEASEAVDEVDESASDDKK